MRPIALLITSVLASTVVTVAPTALACSPIYLQTPSVTAPEAPACLVFTVDNDPLRDATRMDTDVIVTVANSCDLQAELTCTNGCGTWTEPATVPAGGSTALALPGAGTMTWEQDGATGAADVNIDGDWSDCGGPLGCEAGGPEQSSPVLAVVLLLWGLVVVRRRRVSANLMACTR